MESTWENRDLPVLEAIVRLNDQLDDLFGIEALLAAVLSLSDAEVQTALRALRNEQPPLIPGGQRIASGKTILVGAATGEARRRVGAWPTPENLADRIIAALEEAADSATNPEERSRLRRLAEAARDVGSGTVAGILTHGVTNGI